MAQLKILHIEDEPHFQQMVKPLFEQLGFDFYTSNTAEDALNQIQEHNFDVLVVDCFLRSDGINGDKLVEQLLADQGFANVVLYVSSSSRPTFIKKLKGAYPTARITESPKDNFIPTLKELAARGEANADQVYTHFDGVFETANA